MDITNANHITNELISDSNTKLESHQGRQIKHTLTHSGAIESIASFLSILRWERIQIKDSHLWEEKEIQTLQF